MKFTIEKNILLESLNYVLKAISTKNIIPILNGIKLELTKEGLFLTASDSELTIKAIIENKKIKNIEKEGNCVIQSKYILDIIRKMPNDIINIELIDNIKIRIFTENNFYDLNCLEVKDYPNLKLEESKKPIILESKLIKQLINQTSFAVSNQESRPLLTGINIKINGNILECVATDSYRLAKKVLTLKESINEEVNIVIPGKNIIEFEHILGDNDKKVELHIFNNKILFKYENILFQTNLLSGTYPNTSTLIPKDFNFIINTTKDEFYNAIDRAALLTQNKDRNIIKMEVLEKSLKISSFSVEIGKVEETLYINKNNSETMDISYSAKYMLEALKTIKDKDILIMMNADNKPIIIKSVKDETLIQLLLPIKTY